MAREEISAPAGDHWIAEFSWDHLRSRAPRFFLRDVFSDLELAQTNSLSP